MLCILQKLLSAFPEVLHRLRELGTFAVGTLVWSPVPFVLFGATAPEDVGALGVFIELYTLFLLVFVQVLYLICIRSANLPRAISVVDLVACTGQFLKVLTELDGLGILLDLVGVALVELLLVHLVTVGLDHFLLSL